MSPEAAAIAVLNAIAVAKIPTENKSAMVLLTLSDDDGARVAVGRSSCLRSFLISTGANLDSEIDKDFSRLFPRDRSLLVERPLTPLLGIAWPHSLEICTLSSSGCENVEARSLRVNFSKSASHNMFCMSTNFSACPTLP